MSEAQVGQPADDAAAKERFFGNISGDILGGLTAGIVALPLALGFGVASGLDSLTIDGVPVNGALAGMIGAIVVGIMAALLGGTPAQVSGPTGPLTVVAAGMVSEITGDPRWVFAAIALSGAFQIAFGLLRIGKYINYIPYPVISGFMSGIGVIIVILQLPQLLGAPAVGNPVTAVLGLPEIFTRINMFALLLGLATIAVIYATPRFTKKVPGSLVALVLMTLASVVAESVLVSSGGLSWQKSVLNTEFVGAKDVIDLNTMPLAAEDAGLGFLIASHPARLTGKTETATGSPLSGVEVSAPALSAKATSGADGRFDATATPDRLARGDLQVAPGDLVEWTGSHFALLAKAGDDGVPRAGTRLLVTTYREPLAPYRGTPGHVVTFDGESVIGQTAAPEEGWTLLAGGADHHEENHCYIYSLEHHWVQTRNLHLPSIGEIPTGLPSVSLPRAMDWGQFWMILPIAFMLAALASIDSLLTSLVADTITKTRHDSERELIGQGIGNMIAGALGGLPGAGATMRTVINVRSGGRGPLSGVTHGLFLIAVLAGLGPLAARIPHAVLAGILITVGIGIVDYKGLGHLLKIPRGDAAVMLVVLVLTVFVDLMTAVAVGMVMASIILVKRYSDMDPATHSPLKDIAAHRPWIPDLDVPAQVADGIYVVEMHGSLFFGNAGPLQRKLGHLAHADAIILEMSKVTFLDQSGAYAFTDLIQDLQRAGTLVYLANVREEPMLMFQRLNVIPTIVPREKVLDSSQAAVQAAVTGVAKELGHEVKLSEGALSLIRDGSAGSSQAEPVADTGEEPPNDDSPAG